MDRIEITGIEVLGRHGVLASEREHGQRFVVDVVAHLDLATAAGSDRLEDTLDYGVLASEVADIVAGPPSALIEVVASRIADLVLQDERVGDVEVTVHKPDAPLAVAVGDVAVTLRRGRR